MILDNQISVFDILSTPEENKITKEQQETIDKLKLKNTNCEVVLYKSGVVGLISDYDPKPITPYGEHEKRFKPSYRRKTYFIMQDGNYKHIAIGEVR